ncbi:MAG: tyrosine--tRNA ligase [Chloroflexi bacterium]|nr:tyrosine--tRNA ligase [Chloroflexota bacterium]
MTTNTRSIFDELRWRGLIHDYVEGVDKLLAEQKVTLYNGFDPTADSLHVGHLVPMLALARFQRFGHHVMALAGGGTGMIGDPSGKTDERSLLSVDEVQYNVEKIKKQLARFLDFESPTNPARIINNADWLMQLKLIDFLRDIGKHFSVNSMLAKDSVQSRITRESGISYTEFSYSLLQSYDFLYLFETEGCLLQTGGSDQWGNITAGFDLIRRKTGQSAYGITFPLVKKKDGTKFGKTAGNSVWLDSARTSPYKFYQFWLNTDDGDVINYLKVFTFFEEAKIQSFESEMAAHPELRSAQKALAREMTALMHGESALDQALKASDVLFGGTLDGLTADDLNDIFSDVPRGHISRSLLDADGISIISLLVDSGFLKSKGEAKRAIAEGGINVNNQRVAEDSAFIPTDSFIDGKFIVLRRGKKNYYLVALED